MAHVAQAGTEASSQGHQSVFGAGVGGLPGVGANEGEIAEWRGILNGNKPPSSTIKDLTPFPRNLCNSMYSRQISITFKLSHYQIFLLLLR